MSAETLESALVIHISKAASDPSNFASPSFFYGSARSGMSDFLASSSGLSSRTEVLLPAYIGWSEREGSGVFDPIRESGRGFGFYSLNDDLSVDLADFALALANGSYGVAVVIHYFGRIDHQMAEIRAIADAHDVVLVEDLAHGYFSSQNSTVSRTVGDVLLFSLHKQFPLRDGGLVVYRNADLVSDQRGPRGELSEALASYDIRAISEARRTNFLTLTRLLELLPGFGKEFRLLWPDLGDGDVPQSLPVYIVGDNRDEIYARMNSEGFGVVSLYHTLIPEIADDFPVEVDLSRHILNLPVHQDVDRDLYPALVELFHARLMDGR